MTKTCLEFPTKYILSEVVCIKCYHRWIAVRPSGTLLKALYCPKCGEQGFAIETGEVLENE